MNELIKQFVIQAGFSETYGLKEKERLSKFAELIVSDIVGVIRGLQVSAQEDGMLNVAANCDTIAELIEIDYGIEE